jgi:protein involved in polysaccharide export with SLBB domain
LIATPRRPVETTIRKMKSSPHLAALLATFLLAAGCATVGDAADTTPASSNRTDVIQIGDALLITVIKPGDNGPAIPLPEQKVTEAGTISLELVQDVRAAGKTTKELEKAIHDAYVPKYYKRTTVIVRPNDRFFYVDGDVRIPNRFPIAGDMTVTKAIASAGGFTDFGNKKKVKIIRLNGTTEVIDCIKALEDPKRDRQVNPGDRVHVPRRIF